MGRKVLKGKDFAKNDGMLLALATLADKKGYRKIGNRARVHIVGY